MWVWYFVIFVFLLMLIILYIRKNREKPFPELRNSIPNFREEVGEELSPANKIKTQSPIESLSGQSLPYFETTLSLVESTPDKLGAEWSIGNNLKKELTEKYGQEFWHNSQPVLRIYHQNAVPQPYYQDLSVDLDKGKAEVNINAPGETLNSELGIITETGSFIPLVHSNDVIIPKTPE